MPVTLGAAGALLGLRASSAMFQNRRRVSRRAQEPSRRKATGQVKWVDDGLVAGTSFLWDSNDDAALGDGGWCGTAASGNDLTASADHRQHPRHRHWTEGVLCGTTYTLDALEGEVPVWRPSGNGTSLKSDWLCPDVRPFIPYQLSADNSMRSSEGLRSGKLESRASLVGIADPAQASRTIEETRDTRARADRGDIRDRAGS